MPSALAIFGGVGRGFSDYRKNAFQRENIESQIRHRDAQIAQSQQQAAQREQLLSSLGSENSIISPGFFNQFQSQATAQPTNAVSPQPVVQENGAQTFALPQNAFQTVESTPLSPDPNVQEPVSRPLPQQDQGLTRGANKNNALSGFSFLDAQESLRKADAVAAKQVIEYEIAQKGLGKQAADIYAANRQAEEQRLLGPLKTAFKNANAQRFARNPEGAQDIFRVLAQDYPQAVRGLDYEKDINGTLDRLSIAFGGDDDVRKKRNSVTADRLKGQNTLGDSLILEDFKQSNRDRSRGDSQQNRLEYEDHKDKLIRARAKDKPKSKGATVKLSKGVDNLLETAIDKHADTSDLGKSTQELIRFQAKQLLQEKADGAEGDFNETRQAFTAVEETIAEVVQDGEYVQPDAIGPPPENEAELIDGESYLMRDGSTKYYDAGTHAFRTRKTQ